MKKRKWRFYWKETYKNKLCAMVFIIIGIVVAKLDYDLTFLLSTAPFSLALFFAKKNYIIY